MNNNPVHRSILALDIESSTSRPNPIKAELRHEVYRLLHAALAYAGIGEEICDPFEDRGDGVLALIHPVDHVPKTYLLSRFMPELCRLLVEYNVGLPAIERSRRRLRLRVVVHAGEIHFDANGFFGEALDLTCRLLDAPGFKKTLRSVSAPAALVVSDDIFHGIVRHGYDGLREETFGTAVSVQVAGRRHRGHVYVPPARLATTGTDNRSTPFSPAIHAIHARVPRGWASRGQRRPAPHPRLSRIEPGDGTHPPGGAIPLILSSLRRPSGNV